MTLEQASNRDNVGKRIKLKWSDGRIFYGIFTYQFSDFDNTTFVQVDDSIVWWGIKDYSRIILMD